MKSLHIGIVIFPSKFTKSSVYTFKFLKLSSGSLFDMMSFVLIWGKIVR